MNGIILQSTNLFAGMDIVQILQIAGAGLAFLLVFVAYKALISNPDRFKLFATFAVIMMILGIAPTISSQFIDKDKNSSTEISKKLNELQNDYNYLKVEKEDLQKDLDKIKSIWCSNKAYINCNAGTILSIDHTTGKQLWVRMQGYEREFCGMFRVCD